MACRTSGCHRNLHDPIFTKNALRDAAGIFHIRECFRDGVKCVAEQNHSVADKVVPQAKRTGARDRKSRISLSVIVLQEDQRRLRVRRCFRIATVPDHDRDPIDRWLIRSYAFHHLSLQMPAYRNELSKVKMIMEYLSKKMAIPTWRDGHSTSHITLRPFARSTVLRGP